MLGNAYAEIVLTADLPCAFYPFRRPAFFTAIKVYGVGRDCEKPDLRASLLQRDNLLRRQNVPARHKPVDKRVLAAPDRVLDLLPQGGGQFLRFRRFGVASPRQSVGSMPGKANRGRRVYLLNNNDNHLPVTV